MSEQRFRGVGEILANSVENLYTNGSWRGAKSIMDKFIKQPDAEPSPREAYDLAAALNDVTYELLRMREYIQFVRENKDLIPSKI